jgi:hypothetical protein
VTLVGGIFGLAPALAVSVFFKAQLEHPSHGTRRARLHKIHGFRQTSSAHR